MNIKIEYRIIAIVTAILLLWMISGIFAGKSADNTTILGNQSAPIYQTKHSIAEEKPIMTTVNGVVEAAKVVDLRPESTGYVIAIPANEGDFLSASSIILQIDSKATKAKLSEAEAQVAEAKISYQSEKALAAKGLSSDLKMKQAFANLTAANAMLASAMEALSQTTVRMPFDGIVDTIDVEEGDLVAPTMTQPIARLISTEHFKVHCFIPEGKINAIKLGQEVFVKSSSGVVKGEIVSISQVANDETKTFEAEIMLPKHNQLFKSGMGVYVDIPVGTALSHLLPLSAINLNDSGDVIIKYIEDELVKESIVSFIDEGPEGVWLSGLPHEANIVIMGSNNIKTGTKVPEYDLQK